MNELNTYKAGALLPALQAVFSGAFFTLVVAGVILLAGVEQAGVFLLVGGSSCAFIAWFFLLRHWVRLVDTVYHVQPSNVQPVQVLDQVQPSTVKVTLLEQEGGSWRGQYIDLPATPEQVRLLASGVVEGKPLSEEKWCGSGRPFTKNEFHQLRDAFIERGWFQWRNQKAKAQGVDVTHVGRRVFEYLSSGGSPYPTRQDQDW